MLLPNLFPSTLESFTHHQTKMLDKKLDRKLVDSIRKKSHYIIFLGHYLVQ